MPDLLDQKIINAKTTCRLCEGNNLDSVLDLTPTPLANEFVTSDLIKIDQPTFPLGLSLCEDCSHVQLKHVVNRNAMFTDYVYVSGTSKVFVEHFKNYAKQVLDTFKPEKHSLVIDIGSNDGTLLKFFRDAEYKVLGVDPAENIAKLANDSGIETLIDFFDSKLAEEIMIDRGRAEVILANNVFAHIDNLSDVTVGIRDLLTEDGIFIFVVSYLKDVVEKNLFDTIYHEHLSYHSLKPLTKFFHRHGMKIIDAREVASHGGSLRVTVQKASGKKDVRDTVAELLHAESELGLHKRQSIVSLADKIDVLKNELSQLLEEIKSKGMTIAGYGAPAKATTLLYEFGLAPYLEYIIDDSPLKQNLFTPGNHIPVFSYKKVVDHHPDFLIILAWNFAESIIRQNVSYLENGGHFIVPVPEISVH